MNSRKLIIRSLLFLSPLFCFSVLYSVEAKGKTSGNSAKTVLPLPTPDSIISVELVPDTNAISGHGAKLNEQKFKHLIATAKLLSPTEAENIRYEWQYAPYYRENFTTKQGTYSFYLFLGGLGSITPPNQTERTFTFEQPTQ